MSMDVGGSKGGIRADINVTPLVDIMLVLLIIMILVAPLVQQGVSIKLPTATNAAEKAQSQDQTIVAVSSTGDMYLNANPVAKGDLANKINDVLKEKKDKLVLITADKDASYGAVMATMDELRDAGVENLALITDPKKETPGTSSGGR